MTPNPLRILVVDDEAIVRDSLGGWLRQDGHLVDVAESGKQALHLAGAQPYDIALVDVKMPGMDGLEVQSRLAAAVPDVTVIVMTAYASVETAVAALKAGAYDYIVKPFDPDDLSMLIKRAGEHRSLRSENRRLKESLEQVTTPAPLLGDSVEMKRVQELISTVAPSDATVLITGESGTGKELVARAIHARSPRRFNPLVVVNCGALPEGILESELFGHEAGSFTGARGRRKGKFETAEGGTVFLDEIGDVSPKVQVELLRVLEEKAVTRLGGNTPLPVDFRVVAATHRDLAALVREGTFREDLYWRLNVVVIELSPLRERPGDITLLAEQFLLRFAQAMNRRALTLSAATRDALLAYPWPGNVRELQNAVERAVVVTTADVIEPRDLPVRITASQGQAGPLSLADAEKAHIQRVLEANGWNITRAARMLDVDRVTLYNKIRRYHLIRPGEEPGPPREEGTAPPKEAARE